MKKIILLTSLLFLSSCGKFDRFFAGITGDGVETCHKGVAYVQFTSGASVAYNTDGTIKVCN